MEKMPEAGQPVEVIGSGSLIDQVMKDRVP